MTTKVYLTDRQMELCQVKEGDIVQVMCPSMDVEIARIIPFEEEFPPEPNPLARCSRSMLF